jgi:Zn-dependent membrane protease YugP
MAFSDALPSGISVTARLTPAELQRGLLDGTQGDWKIDVLHLDACLMALVENAYDLRGSANLLVASQNLGWALYDYAGYASLAISQSISPRALATGVAWCRRWMRWPVRC